MLAAADLPLTAPTSRNSPKILTIKVYPDGIGRHPIAYGQSGEGNVECHGRRPRTEPATVPSLYPPLIVPRRQGIWRHPVRPLKPLRDELLSELTPIETDVLGVAKEILKLKKYPAEISVERVELMSPIVDKIYAKCIARFENQKGYKKEAIFSAIKNLEAKKWIITNQRTTKAEILKNPIIISN